MNFNKESNFYDIVYFGKFYFPSWKHYGDINADVRCDRCFRTNLICSLGYRNYDLCMDCTEIVCSKNGILPKPGLTKMEQSIFKPSNITYMEQDMFKYKYITHMEQDMFRQEPQLYPGSYVTTSAFSIPMNTESNYKNFTNINKYSTLTLMEQNIFKK